MAQPIISIETRAGPLTISLTINKAGRAERKYYRWGGVFSGPIIKDKTFFLFALERQNDNVAQPTTFFVPTAKQRIGDFSEIPGTIIYNPSARLQAVLARPETFAGLHLREISSRLRVG
jgi:hypothetical protein